MVDFKKLKDLANQAATVDDQTRKSASFERELPMAGKTIARFVEYIELGKQPRKPYRGQPRDPIDGVRITFELLGTKQKNVKVIELDDGTKKEIAQRISLRLNKSTSDKASYRKLLNKMRYGRSEITHMAQMLNEVFIVTVFHRLDDETKQPKYANLIAEAGAEYSIEPPFSEDPLTGKRTIYTCREAVGELKLFLWNNPTKETWDSLYIDGTREVTDAQGHTKEVSKNWIQGILMSAVNFNGSPLDQLIGGATVLPEFKDEDDTADFDGDTGVAPVESTAAQEKKPASAVKAKATPKTAKAVQSTSDVFANLGVESDDLNDAVPF